jgi:hypothetical protein
VKEAWLALLQQQHTATTTTTTPTSTTTTTTTTPTTPRVPKEDLVVLDPDLLTDYPPLSGVAIRLPAWIKVGIDMYVGM